MAESASATVKEKKQDDKTAGEPESLKNKVLETGAGIAQNFAPTQRICAHLNAFHVYADEPSRFVEANHYCAHVNDEVRQCIIYDSPEAGARIIGIEYMISPRLFKTLSPDEQKLWHTHAFEVRSGMLLMPPPPVLPTRAWEAAEDAEMRQVVHLYGKVFHLWQTDRGHQLPLGQPQLMTSFTDVEQMGGEEKFAEVVGERDARLGGDWKEKREKRAGIEGHELVGNADWTWRKEELGGKDG